MSELSIARLPASQKPITATLKDIRSDELIDILIKECNDNGIEIVLDQHVCNIRTDLIRVDSPANSIYWRSSGSSESYQVYKCKICNDVLGCRHQYDAGTGADDKWKVFGQIDPAEVKRHY